MPQHLGSRPPVDHRPTAGRQRIDRVRRAYNKWAADETLEDFALRFTAVSARRWSSLQVGQTALGAVSFLALEAIGGSITLSYGFTDAALAIVASAFVIFATALPICICAAKAGVDIDLLTRGAGFGYIGSTVTSLIYASFTFLFFAIEVAEPGTGLGLTICRLLSNVMGGDLDVTSTLAVGSTFRLRLFMPTLPAWAVS